MEEEFEDELLFLGTEFEIAEPSIFAFIPGRVISFMAVPVMFGAGLVLEAMTEVVGTGISSTVCGPEEISFVFSKVFSSFVCLSIPFGVLANMEPTIGSSLIIGVATAIILFSSSLSTSVMDPSSRSL